MMNPKMRKAMARVLRLAAKGKITEKEGMSMMEKLEKGEHMMERESKESKTMGSKAHAEAMKKRRAALAATVMRRSMKRGRVAAC